MHLLSQLHGQLAYHIQRPAASERALQIDWHTLFERHDFFQRYAYPWAKHAALRPRARIHATNRLSHERTNLHLARTPTVSTAEAPIPAARASSPAPLQLSRWPCRVSHLCWHGRTTRAVRARAGRRRPRRYKFYLQIDVRAVNEHSLRIWQVRRRRSCVCALPLLRDRPVGPGRRHPESALASLASTSARARAEVRMCVCAHVCARTRVGVCVRARVWVGGCLCACASACVRLCARVCVWLQSFGASDGLRWKELRCLSAVAQRLPFVSGITFTMVRLQRRQQWLKLQGWVESRLRHLILKLETLLLKTGLAHPFPDAFQSPDTQERRRQLNRTSCRDAIAPLQRGFVACRLRFV